MKTTAKRRVLPHSQPSFPLELTVYAKGKTTKEKLHGTDGLANIPAA